MSLPESLYPLGDTLVRLRTILMGRGYPLRRDERTAPFFIVGSGRCGTTLLRRILQASAQVHIPPETYMFGPAIKFFRRNRDRPWSTLVRTVLSMFEYHDEFDSFGVSLRPLAQELFAVPEKSRSLARILDRFMRYHGEQTGQTFERWGDKTPLNCFWLDHLVTVFPDARFVHLLRDGVDVVQSLRKAKLGYDLHSAARRWTTAVAAVEAFAAKHAARCHEVRYEELVVRPEGVLRRLCEFLRLRYEPHMIECLEHKDELRDLDHFAHHTNVFKPINTTSVGKGRRDLPAAERRELQTMMGADLQRLGYDPVT